jgi:glutaredoxin-related protein
MLHLTVCATALVLGGSPARPSAQRVGDSPVMMPKFLQELFPTLEKPGAPPVVAKEPNLAVSLAGKAMPLLGPIFNFEAVVQALVTNLGGYDEDEVRTEIADTVKSAPVVIYTYPLSPFSSEALAVLESTGCEIKNVPLGLEWFALGPKGSATRVELRKLYGQGSLPHCFIGGEWVGGLATGADGGLAGLVERDELVPKLRKARAL